MTIKKGEPWGEPVEQTPPDVAHAADDAELAAMADRARAAGEHLVCRVDSGDLLRTLGMTERRGADAELVAYSMDLGFAQVHMNGNESAGQAMPFVAHALVGRSGSGLGITGLGITVAVMNAAMFGEYRLGPRAHPNDGLLDITVGQVPFRERREATDRAKSGSHLPHPDLQVIRTKSWSIDFSKPQSVSLDGVVIGRARSLAVEVVPDAFTVLA